MVCPYGVIGRHLEEHKAYRCDRCPDRQTPACVEACVSGALTFELPAAALGVTRMLTLPGITVTIGAMVDASVGGQQFDFQSK